MAQGNEAARYYFGPKHRVRIFDIYDFKQGLGVQNSKSHAKEIELLTKAFSRIRGEIIPTNGESPGYFSKDEIMKTLQEEAKQKTIEGRFFVHIVVILTKAPDEISIYASDEKVLISDLEQEFVKEYQKEVDPRLSNPKWFIIQAPQPQNRNLEDILKTLYENIAIPDSMDIEDFVSEDEKFYLKDAGGGKSKIEEKEITVPDRINFITAVSNLPGNVYIRYFAQVLYEYGPTEEINDLLKEVHRRTFQAFEQKDILFTAAPYYKSSLFKELYFKKPYGPYNKEPTI